MIDPNSQDATSAAPPDTSAQSQAAPTAPAASQNAPPAAAPQPTSRLGSIMQAVSQAVTTGLAGIPDKGRPSIITGLGEGAREAQAIKFKNFDDQVRLAQLHNQDLKMQQDTQAQTDAHTKADLENRQLANSLGIDYDTLPSHGPTIMNHLQAQTAANGAASVPAGTHLSGDGETVNIPQNTQQTRDGQKQMYTMLGPAFGLPALPTNAQFVPPQLMNMLTNKIHGYGIDGKPISHEDLPGMVGALQTQRDQMAKSGAPDPVLKAMDNTLGIYKANLDSLDKHAAGVLAQNKQAQLDTENSAANVTAASNKAAKIKQAELDVTNSPANQAAAAQGAAQKTTAETNAKNEAAGLNAVAFDPNYQNPDGSKGANVVMNNADAAAKGLKAYKASPEKLNATVAGMNDVQNKLNQLAAVTTDPTRMGAVQPGVAAAMLEHGKGIQADFHGVGVDTSRINEKLYEEDVKQANQATRDYVTAMVAAHEAVTQLPRLQTFGTSSRMTQQQMEAAVNLLPHPGDGTMAAQKMESLQGMIDPLRKQIPHMPGAETIPSWTEQRKQAAQQQQQNAPKPVGRFNPSSKTIDWVKQQ